MKKIALCRTYYGIYGQNLEVTFLHKLREEKKFSSFEALKHQISLDVEAAQAYLTQ